MARCTVWIDASRGFTPTRMDHQRRAKSAGADVWDEPFEQCEVTWKQINNVWVPESFVAWFRPRQGYSEEYDLAFAWESVNEPVEDVVFSAKGLELKPRSVIVDARAPNPSSLISSGLARSEPKRASG